MADKRFIAHIATEVVVVFGIVLFFFRQKQRLEERVAHLEDSVRKMNETLANMARINAQVVEQPPINYFPQRRNAVVFATCNSGVCDIPDRKMPPLTDRVEEVPFEELISSECLSIDDEIAEELSELQVSTKDKPNNE